MFERKVRNRFPEVVPEIENSMGTRPEESGAEHHIRPAAAQGSQEVLELHRLVFEVGVLYGNKLAGGLVEPSPKRSSLTLVFRVAEQPDLGMLPHEVLSDHRAPIA